MGDVDDPLIHHITSSIAPGSLVLNKPANPELSYLFVTIPTMKCTLCLGISF